MKRVLAVVVILTSLIACQPENRVYSDHQELSPDVEWLKKDVREFKVPIEDNSISYDLSLSFRYATGYPYETANVKVIETSPSGVETIKEHVLTVRDSNGDYIGDAGYDIWDSEHLVEPNKKFPESGVYTYVIEQNTPKDPLVFAMEIGVVVDKVIYD